MSFVEYISAHGNHVKFQHHLSDVLSIAPETMPDVGSLLEVSQPVCEALDELDKLVLPAPDSGRRLWKSYVEAQYEAKYWFSVDELRLLCVLGGRSETFSLYRI